MSQDALETLACDRESLIGRTLDDVFCTVADADEERIDASSPKSGALRDALAVGGTRGVEVQAVGCAHGPLRAVLRATRAATKQGPGWLVQLSTLATAAASPQAPEAPEAPARATAALEELAYVVSHDLREPLRGIHSFVDILLEDHGGALDDGARGKLATLVRLTERMDGLLDALLDYSRLGRADDRPGPVDMNAAFTAARHELSDVVATRRAELRAASDLPHVHCRREPAARVFRELIRNALTYTSGHSPSVEVGWAPAEKAPAELRNPERWPTFFVRDSGIGIEPDHHAAIFRMFRRLHSRGAYGGGIGAGLALVRRIVDLHAAELWVDSAPGQGSTFWFTLGPEVSERL